MELVVKNPPAEYLEIWVQSLGQEDRLEKEMATHSSILAWGMTWTEEPGRLESIGVAKSRTRLKRLSSSDKVIQPLNSLHF